jgi:hypothetical protein
MSALTRQLCGARRSAVRVKRGLAQSERTMDKLYADYLLASRDAPPAVRLVMTDSTADGRREETGFQDRGRYRDRGQRNFYCSEFFGDASSAWLEVCWRRPRASSPRAITRPFGLRGLTPAASSNQGLPCVRRIDVPQRPAEWARAAPTIHRSPRKRWHGARPSIWRRIGGPSLAEVTVVPTLHPSQRPMPKDAAIHTRAVGRNRLIAPSRSRHPLQHRRNKAIAPCIW